MKSQLCKKLQRGGAFISEEEEYKIIQEICVYSIPAMQTLKSDKSKEDNVEWHWLLCDHRTVKGISYCNTLPDQQYDKLH